MSVVGIACATASAGGALGGDPPELPIREIRGHSPGPTIALVAGVHGGKRAAVAALDSFARIVDPALLYGRLLIVSPANVAGYNARLPQTSPADGLNLNRVFPGRVDGRPTERLAARIMREVVAESDFLIDLHGSDGTESVGTFVYAARPGLDPRIDSAALQLARAFQPTVVVWDEDGPRTLAESRFLQTAAHLSGVPAITAFVSGSTSDDVGARNSILWRLSEVVRALTGTNPITPTYPTGYGVERVYFEPGGGIRTEPVPDSIAALMPVNGVGRLNPFILNRREVITAPRSGAWVDRVRGGRMWWRDPTELIGIFTDSTGKVDTLWSPRRGFALHVRLAGPVPAGTPLVIFAPAPDSLTPP